MSRNPWTILLATLSWKTQLIIAFLYSFPSRCGTQSPVLSLYDTYFIRLYLFLEHLFCPTAPSIPPPTSSCHPNLPISFEIESSPFSYLRLLHSLLYFFQRMKHSWFTMLCLFRVYSKGIQLCICIYIHILFHILFHYGSWWDIESRSLCYTVGPCCLSSLYIVVYIC